LLRREFPDVTISKIRFLESQGLVNPERTPSGYRKFYEPDVERLRWVLRQQREHFLPLKVIKGRLEEETSTGAGNGRESRRAEHPSAGRAAHSSKGAGSEERVSAVLVGDRAASSGALAGTESSEPKTAAVLASVPDLSPRGKGLTRGAEDHAQEPPDEGPVGSAVQDALRVEDTARREAPKGTVRPIVGEPPEPPGLPDPDAANTGRVAAMNVFSGTSMTAEELGSASGLDPGEVHQLESFGLLAGRSIGGVAYFDEGALVVARLAAAFARYGVEARHLRLHLLAAQREAGFVEQVVLPLLKQRNPSSRQRAHETVAELSRLGQELRAVLLQTRLREQLGG